MKQLALVLSFWMSMAFADNATTAGKEEPSAKPAQVEAGTKKADTEPTFTGDALTVKNKMVELFDASKKVNGAEKAEGRKKLENALDWDKVAKACLGPSEWAKQPAKNRAEFTALLKDVVVNTAYTRMESFWDKTTYKFTKIDVKSGDAHVVSRFDASGDVITLDYYLTKKGSEWLVYDISFEDNRYSTNINEQLTAFLREKSFPQLITSLKKRRDDLASGKTKKSKG